MNVRNNKRQQEINRELELQNEQRMKLKLNSIWLVSSIKQPDGQDRSFQDLKCSISFPKGYNISYALSQKLDDTVSKIEEKSRQQKCSNWNKNYRKYLCKMTNQVSWSYECYKAIREQTVLSKI